MERNDISGLGAARPALSAAVLRRSALAAVVVGTLLTALNHGDVILRGAWSPALWWKVPLTFLVPFLVATYGALGARGATQPGRALPADRDEPRGAHPGDGKAGRPR